MEEELKRLQSLAGDILGLAHDGQLDLDQLGYKATTEDVRSTVRALEFIYKVAFEERRRIDG